MKFGAVAILAGLCAAKTVKIPNYMEYLVNEPNGREGSNYWAKNVSGDKHDKFQIKGEVKDWSWNTSTFNPGQNEVDELIWYDNQRMRRRGEWCAYDPADDTWYWNCGDTIYSIGDTHYINVEGQCWDYVSWFSCHARHCQLRPEDFNWSCNDGSWVALQSKDDQENSSSSMGLVAAGAIATAAGLFVARQKCRKDDEAFERV